jgi:hypothetical protein
MKNSFRDMFKQQEVNVPDTIFTQEICLLYTVLQTLQYTLFSCYDECGNKYNHGMKPSNSDENDFVILLVASGSTIDFNIVITKMQSNTFFVNVFCRDADIRMAIIPT